MKWVKRAPWHWWHEDIEDRCGEKGAQLGQGQKEEGRKEEKEWGGCALKTTRAVRWARRERTLMMIDGRGCCKWATRWRGKRIGLMHRFYWVQRWDTCPPLHFSPSSHRMYSSLVMGDCLTGEASAALSALGVVGVVTAPGADGPVTSSTTLVTTSPQFVILLFHITYLWGKSILDVCTCC